jgi:hypothetical protein
LTARQVYEDQMKLKRENELKKIVRPRVHKKMMKKRVKEKKKSEKKRDSEETDIKTKKKQVSFYAKASDVKSAFYTS